MKVLYTSTISTSPLGPMKVYSYGETLLALATNTQPYTPPSHTILKTKELPIFSAVSAWLDIYWQGEDLGPIPPLDLQGTDFQVKVWEELLRIPYGHLSTYGDLAEQIRPSANKGLLARAIGGAVGANPLPILIPCHRIIGSNGKLIGYSGGLWIKELLLEKEGIDLAKLTDREYRHSLMNSYR